MACSKGPGATYFDMLLPVSPKNSIPQLYQPAGHTSNRVTTETMTTNKHRILCESGCFTGRRRRVATN